MTQLIQVNSTSSSNSNSNLHLQYVYKGGARLGAEGIGKGRGAMGQGTWGLGRDMSPYRALLTMQL